MNRKTDINFVILICLTFTILPCILLIDKGLARQKKILYVNSYNQGYAWSDGIARGIVQTIKGKGILLKIHEMDTKRNRSDLFLKKAALKTKTIIENFAPDVVITSDDNAAKYLIMPYFRNAKLPFVFCGINWDASVYGLPCENVTGMIEVAPVPQLIEYLKTYSKGDRVGFLAPNLLSAKKEVDKYITTFGLDLTIAYSENIDQWKQAFLNFQQKVDMLIIDSDGGLYQNHEQELIRFVEKNSKIPSGTILDFMAPYSLITFAKVAEEQGAWAAEAALKIIKGEKPSSIPVSYSRDGYLIVNTRIAKTAGFDIPYSILKSARRIIE